MFFFFFFQAEDGIRDYKVTGVQTCALPICSLPRYSAASVGPKSPYSRFTQRTALFRTASAIFRFDARPRSRCRIPPSPSLRSRATSVRTQRSLSFNCSPACFCVTCPFSASCNTFNRSRSLWLIHSSCWFFIRLVCRSSTGTFYFAARGTSHFAATHAVLLLSRQSKKFLFLAK